MIWNLLDNFVTLTSNVLSNPTFPGNIVLSKILDNSGEIRSQTIPVDLLFSHLPASGKGSRLSMVMKKEGSAFSLIHPCIHFKRRMFISTRGNLLASTACTSVGLTQAQACTGKG